MFVAGWRGKDVAVAGRGTARVAGRTPFAGGKQRPLAGRPCRDINKRDLLRGGHSGRLAVATDHRRAPVRVSGEREGEGSVWRSRRCGITI